MFLLPLFLLAAFASAAQHLHPHPHRLLRKSVCRPRPVSTSSTSITTQAVVVSKPPARSTTPTTLNNKAGIAGGDAYPIFKDHIGWWYDWSPAPSKPPSSSGSTPLAIPMLWGGGTVDAQDAQRLTAFTKLSNSVSSLSTPADVVGQQFPAFVLGFEEPDCASGSGSAGMSVDEAVEKWESLMAPMKKRGVKLGSPSMCKQADETWLSEFKSNITTDWDFTAIHVNKNNLEGVKNDINHYLNYKKPLWVTEFACVNDKNGFVPCTNQDEINNYINTVVTFFESNKDIEAYAYSNGLGLGDVWPLINAKGELSDSGKTYLEAIKRFH